MSPELQWSRPTGQGGEGRGRARAALSCTDYSTGDILVSGTGCKGPWVNRGPALGPHSSLAAVCDHGQVTTSVCLNFLLCKTGTVPAPPYLTGML